MFVPLSDKEYFARFGSIEFFQLLDRVAPGTQHHNSFFIFGIQFRMDFATDFLCRLGTLNQNMAIPIMCVIANLWIRVGTMLSKPIMTMWFCKGKRYRLHDIAQLCVPAYWRLRISIIRRTKLIPALRPIERTNADKVVLPQYSPDR